MTYCEQGPHKSQLSTALWEKIRALPTYTLSAPLDVAGVGTWNTPTSGMWIWLWLSLLITPTWFVYFCDSVMELEENEIRFFVCLLIMGDRGGGLDLYINTFFPSQC